MNPPSFVWILVSIALILVIILLVTQLFDFKGA